MSARAVQLLRPLLRLCRLGGSALLDHVASVHSNSVAMQQFWTEELSSMMARLKLCVAAAGMGVDGQGRQG